MIFSLKYNYIELFFNEIKQSFEKFYLSTKNNQTLNSIILS